MNPTSAAATISGDLAPNHAEIEQCARELWTNFGQPKGRDDEIWLEAERRLISAQRAPLPAFPLPETLTRQRGRPVSIPDVSNVGRTNRSVNAHSASTGIAGPGLNRT